MKPQTVIFFGMQGSGKGTQVNRLKERLTTEDPNRAVFHYETGNGFRSLAEMNGYTAQLVREGLSQGNVMPSFLADMLWSQAFRDDFRGDEHIVIDGFPRSIEQAETLHGALEFYNRLPSHVIHLKISEEIAIDRLLKRGRHDDTKEGIEKRLSWYKHQVAPIIEWYTTLNDYTVHSIDGEQTEEQIYQAVCDSLNLS